MESWFSNRSEHININFLLRYDTEEFLVVIRSGHIADIRKGVLVMPHWSFSMTAASTDWDKFWGAEPVPGYNDILALVKFGRLKIEGDLTVFMQNLFYFKQLLSGLGAKIHG